MDELREMIEIEYEKLEQVLKGLPAAEKLPFISELELAGVATYLHNFYNGMENILKRIFKSNKIPLPSGASWHTDLLNQSVLSSIISEQLKDSLSDFLGFRHFFSHAYAIDLNTEKLEELVSKVDITFKQLKSEIDHYTKDINR